MMETVNPDTGEIINVMDYRDTIFVRTPYNYDPMRVTKETGLRCDDPTLAQQQFKDECDINVILEKFAITGHLPIVSTQPMSGDFTGIGDYHEAVLALQEAQDNFMALPSKVRERFNNDPAQFVDFCVDPKNIESVRELGLAPRIAAPIPQPIVKEDDGKK